MSDSQREEGGARDNRSILLVGLVCLDIINRCEKYDSMIIYSLHLH